MAGVFDVAAYILRKQGGRTRGTNHHFVEVENLTRQAKTRLAQIGMMTCRSCFPCAWMRRNA